MWTRSATRFYVNSLYGGERHLLAQNVFAVRPAWSPDGRRIAFTSGKQGVEQIYVMNADGSNAHPVTQGSAANFLPAWSPGGKRIAFTSSRDHCGDDYRIYVVEANGSNSMR
jgi:TolB protein